jgi:transposase
MYVGIDVHKADCSVTVIGEKAEIVDQYSIRNTVKGWQRFFQRTSADSEVAIEASTASCPVFDLLVSKGYEVKLAHPMDLALIGKSRQKTDKKDSYILAVLLKSGFYPKATLPSRESRAERELHRHRIVLGKKRGKVQTQIKSLISRAVISDGEVKISDIMTESCRSELKKLPLMTAERLVVDHLLSEIDFLSSQINKVESELRKLAKKNHFAWIFMTVQGISYYSAMTVVNEVGDINRFRSSKQFCSYVGVVPRVFQTGEKEITGRITKRGNSYLRWILNQCVIHTVRYESPIRDFYLRVKEKKGECIARTAAVRKLVKIIFHMMKNREEYRYQDRELTIRKWRAVYGKSLRPECPPPAGT